MSNQSWLSEVKSLACCPSVSGMNGIEAQVALDPNAHSCGQVQGTIFFPLGILQTMVINAVAFEHPFS